MNDSRPNPDELLAHVKRQEALQQRGRLKVFFGAAAGVGKTFAMLEEARARAAEGLDVVAGYVEVHARQETEALLLGLELLPFKIVEYKGASLKEFDLDAALARRPALVLVDELAHTNAPGLRHQKRWQDVVELLDAGINVYTTLNVQHLESVNDLVERITGVRVRETLPDAALDQADEVELVDTAPDELLERFREGKIYRPEQAGRALHHFFTKGNLIALRELALRRTADRVDAQMLDFRREHAVESSWAASERILVCIGPSPLSARLVRATRRLAAGLKARWVAVYVETPGRLSEPDRARVDRHLRLAEELDGQAVVLSGQSVAQEALAYALAQNITRIVIGKPARARWRDRLFGSFVDQIIRDSGRIDIHVIRGEPDEAEPPPAHRPEQRGRDVRGMLWAVGLTALVTGAGWVLYHRLGMANTNILMGYLLVVLWMGTHHSRGAAVLASLLGVAAFDFCFVRPYLTFVVSDQQYIVTFGIMLATALVINTLTQRVRAQGEAARRRERRTAALLAMSRELAANRSVDDIVAVATRHVGDVLAAGSFILIRDVDGRLAPRGASARAFASEHEMTVAQWVFEHAQPAGRGTSTLPGSEGTYLPLVASRGTVGVLGLFFDRPAELWSVEQRQLAEAFASQAAGALERAALAEEARRAWERVEAEFLRNTLLSGVSHDLRTPLAAITGAASALLEPGTRLPEASRAELIDTIYSEAERMERLINNLLDMTRMESGGLTLNRQWHPPADIVGAALRHLDRRLRGRPVINRLPADLPLLHVDEVAMEQVLVNLLDNAAAYTPPGSPIEISAFTERGQIVLEVADAGPGLPEGSQQRVFEKFYRAGSAHRSGGVGLGLAICRGIVQMHGGQISAGNRPGGGAVFRIAMSLETPPPVVEPSGGRD